LLSPGVFKTTLAEPEVKDELVQLAEQEVAFEDDQEISTVPPELISIRFELIFIEGNGITEDPPPPPPHDDNKNKVVKIYINLLFILKVYITLTKKKPLLISGFFKIKFY
jgi:hypothetical protein|tara:strand:+ start:1402 stop:1731 length:330 start_codon:yes stop_codon:yes gene_type:complete